VPLLGKAEKGQLEEMIRGRLQAHYDANGPAALLAENLRVVVTVDGAALDSGEAADPLAAVELRTLFTALCYLSTGSPAMPREALEALATEATAACATQINRIAAD
jgi:hypothetical protein